MSDHPKPGESAAPAQAAEAATTEPVDETVADSGVEVAPEPEPDPNAVAITLNGKPIGTRACRELSDATIATTGPQYFTQSEGDRFMALAGKTDHKRMVMGGDCYNYALLATGFIDVVCESGLKLHDFAALVPVVEGAGGMMCDWNGEPLHGGSAGDVLALGDPARLDDVLDAMGGGHGHGHGHGHDHAH